MLFKAVIGKNLVLYSKILPSILLGKILEYNITYWLCITKSTNLSTLRVYHKIKSTRLYYVILTRCTLNVVHFELW